MIEKFHTYNETLRDKMTPKIFSKEDKEIIDKFEELGKIVVDFTDVKKMGDFYYSHLPKHGITITYIHPNYHETDMKLGDWVTYKNWTIYTNTQLSNNDTRMEDIINTDDFDVIIKSLIDIIYKDSSFNEYIIKVKNEISKTQQEMKNKTSWYTNRVHELEEEIKTIEYARELRNK